MRVVILHATNVLIDQRILDRLIHLACTALQDGVIVQGEQCLDYSEGDHFGTWDCRVKTVFAVQSFGVERGYTFSAYINDGTRKGAVEYILTNSEDLKPADQVWKVLVRHGEPLRQGGTN